MFGNYILKTDNVFPNVNKKKSRYAFDSKANKIFLMNIIKL